MKTILAGSKNVCTLTSRATSIKTQMESVVSWNKLLACSYRYGYY